MHDLTAFQRDQLYAIAGLDEPHGVAVKERLDEYYDETVLSSRLYPNLDELVDRGLVEKGALNDRANTYTLTPRGHDLIEERHGWLARHVEDPERGDVHRESTAGTA